MQSEAKWSVIFLRLQLTDRMPFGVLSSVHVWVFWASLICSLFNGIGMNGDAKNRGGPLSLTYLAANSHANPSNLSHSRDSVSSPVVKIQNYESRRQLSEVKSCSSKISALNTDGENTIASWGVIYFCRFQQVINTSKDVAKLTAITGIPGVQDRPDPLHSLSLVVISSQCNVNMSSLDMIIPMLSNNIRAS